MYPGYRSDVLFQAPTVTGSEYLLVDEEVPADKTVSGDPKSRRYLARIIVEGDPVTMTLPTDAQLNAFKLPSLGSPTEAISDPTLSEIHYGPRDLDGDGNAGPFLSIDGKQFDHDTARQKFKLGDIVERTLTAPALHVFHIHVNPFEIISIKNEAGTELINDPEYGGPHFRDTVAIPARWHIKFRMELKTFESLFVQHCHILDHEDGGMMDLVEVETPAPVVSGVVPRPYASPEWSLPDPRGVPVNSRSLAGRPTVVVFFEGFGCLQCNEQLKLLQAKREWFDANHVHLACISNDRADVLAEAAKGSGCQLLLAADPELRVFRQFGCSFKSSPLHGVFVLDGAQKVVWRNVSTQPYMQIDDLQSVVETLLTRTAKRGS